MDDDRIATGHDARIEFLLDELEILIARAENTHRIAGCKLNFPLDYFQEMWVCSKIVTKNKIVLSATAERTISMPQID